MVLFIVFVSLFRNAYGKEMKLVSVCFTDAAWDKFDEKKSNKGMISLFSLNEAYKPASQMSHCIF